MEKKGLKAPTSIFIAPLAVETDYFMIYMSHCQVTWDNSTHFFTHESRPGHQLPSATRPHPPGRTNGSNGFGGPGRLDDTPPGLDPTDIYQPRPSYLVIRRHKPI